MAAAVITSTHQMGHPTAPQFTGLKAGMIQELPFRTPYDEADRWHLSKLCAKLGIAHRYAERRVVLVQMILMAEESGRVNRDHALGLLAEIMRKMTRDPNAGLPERGWVDLEVPAINQPAPQVDAVAPVAPPSPESELWRLAELTNKELMDEARKIGVPGLKPTMKRADLFALFRQHLKA